MYARVSKSDKGVLKMVKNILHLERKIKLKTYLLFVKGKFT